jgi:Phospholipase_D-nuclease N-terminal/Short C-terminal domain
MPLLEFFWTMLVIFGFVLWFWLLFVIIGDVFRRDDMSGWGKTAWLLFMIVLPFLGVFVYVIAQGRSMAERRSDEVAANRARYEQDVRRIAGDGDRPADQIVKAKQLLASGDITHEEYEQLKRRALGTSPGTATMTSS